MDLNSLKPSPGSRRSKKRLGRGIGSGLGKTAGRGQKGQNSRSGGGVPAGFEGGQMPLHRRLPKRGFHNQFAKNFIEVNVGQLSAFESGAVVDAEALRAAGIVKKTGDGVKILGNGEIGQPLTVRVHRISAGARSKIEAAGGTVELIGSSVE